MYFYLGTKRKQIAADTRAVRGGKPVPMHYVYLHTDKPRILLYIYTPSTAPRQGFYTIPPQTSIYTAYRRHCRFARYIVVVRYVIGAQCVQIGMVAQKGIGATMLSRRVLRCALGRRVQSAIGAGLSSRPDGVLGSPGSDVYAVSSKRPVASFVTR